MREGPHKAVQNEPKRAKQTASVRGSVQRTVSVGSDHSRRNSGGTKAFDARFFDSIEYKPEVEDVTNLIDSNYVEHLALVLLNQICMPYV